MNFLSFLAKAYKYAIMRLKHKYFWQYYFNRIQREKIASSAPSNDAINEKLVNQFKSIGVKTIEYSINVQEYNQYLTDANYERYKYYDKGNDRNFTEKTLEHYLALQFLDLSNDDIYIDIANANSPTDYIYSRLSGCKSFRQDIIFPEGLHGNIIGGDAGNLPVPDGFASKMALHCSFEHFENDSDIRFIKEVSRILKPGGRVCILPLYLTEQYGIQTDPVCLPKGPIPFEEDALLYCVNGYGNRHGRFYDIQHFQSRILDNLNENMSISIYWIKNEKDINPSCYVKFAAILEKVNG